MNTWMNGAEAPGPRAQSSEREALRPSKAACSRGNAVTCTPCAERMHGKLQCHFRRADRSAWAARFAAAVSTVACSQPEDRVRSARSSEPSRPPLAVERHRRRPVLRRLLACILWRRRCLVVLRASSRAFLQTEQTDELFTEGRVLPAPPRAIGFARRVVVPRPCLSREAGR
jgi:hypothetical protein